MVKITDRTKYIYIYKCFRTFRRFLSEFLFGPGNFLYKYTNQSIKMGLFISKILMYPMIFFYLSITIERFTVYNLVVLYIWNLVFEKHVNTIFFYLFLLWDFQRAFPRKFPGRNLTNQINFECEQDQLAENADVLKFLKFCLPPKLWSLNSLLTSD